MQQKRIAENSAQSWVISNAEVANEMLKLTTD